MQFLNILRVISLLLMLFSMTMLPPIFVSWYFQDHLMTVFIQSFSLTFITGLVSWIILYRYKKMLKTRDGFLIVVLFWAVLSLFGALPFLFATDLSINFVDALFESASGITTTGATVLSHIDDWPSSLQYYRQQLQFFGGMGIVVLAVAVLPMLGIGGMQLYRVDTAGPMKDNKLTPRIAETAKALWIIYVSLTLACMLAYKMAGMEWFEAIGQSFSTISTGGFAMHDASFAYYHNNTINLIAIVFMFLGGISFGLHFFAFRRFSLQHYWQDTEFRSYMMSILILTTIIVAEVIWFSPNNELPDSILRSLFAVLAVVTTTGYTLNDPNQWPSFIPYLLMFAGIVGGCAASTSGGIKLMRMILIIKQIMRELTHLVHPNAVLTVKFGKQVLPEKIIQGIWSYLSVFIVTFIMLLLVFLFLGVDFASAFGLLVMSISNVGIGTGAAAANVGALSSAIKSVMIVAMLAGRLEIFALLLLFTPTFWRK